MRGRPGRTQEEKGDCLLCPLCTATTGLHRLSFQKNEKNVSAMNVAELHLPDVCICLWVGALGGALRGETEHSWPSRSGNRAGSSRARLPSFYINNNKKQTFAGDGRAARGSSNVS